MPTPIYTVDAFTDCPFAGNPAAVCLLPAAADEAWMQRVAAEMNLSETAFVHPLDGGDWSLRWFTPAAEVELCGHATLASAHLLGELGRAAAGEPIRFQTRHRGTLTCTRDAAGRIAMDFPADPAAPADPPAGLLATLQVDAVAVGRSRYDWLVELADEAAVLAVRPDFPALAAFDTRGVLVTARADRKGIDFVSRFFAPRLRINEDPVTGSAHCVLAPWWAAKLSRDALTGYQASPRGGTVGVILRGDRVELAGRAVTVIAGELR